MNINMTLSQAIEKAEGLTKGATFHPESDGWLAVMAVLLSVVKADSVIMENCQCAEEAIKTGLSISLVATDKQGEITVKSIRWKDFYKEPQGPLPAAILADMLDQHADELADSAKEVEIYSISKTHISDWMQGAARQMVKFAGEIREEK